MLWEWKAENQLEGMVKKKKRERGIIGKVKKI